MSNSHITGAAIKIANIFAKRHLRANYEEIADYVYILNAEDALPNPHKLNN